MCCGLNFAYPWSDKQRNEPRTTEKNKSTRFSKLLSITYESSSDDQDKQKSERRIYDSTTGFREPKFCQSCNDQPWIPVVKFSQRAPKNIIYQEEQYVGGGNDNFYNSAHTHLIPPPYETNKLHNSGSQQSHGGLPSHETHPQSYDGVLNHVTNSETYGEISHHVTSPQTYGGVQSHLTPPETYYNHNRQPQQFYSTQDVSSSYHVEPEVKPKLTPCDLLRHNHDSLSEGSETLNTIENDDPLMNHLQGYKEPPPKSDKFFRYFSYVKHPDMTPKQNLWNNFTNPVRGNNYHNAITPNIPRQTLPPFNPKREKDLYPVHSYEQKGQNEQSNNMIETGNDIVTHHQHQPSFINGVNDFRKPENYETKKPRPSLTTTYHKPMPSLTSPIPINPIIQYPPKIGTERYLNQIHSPFTLNTMQQLHIPDNPALITPLTTNLDQNIPAQFLTPPNLESANRDGREYQHFIVPEKSIAADNSVDPHSYVQPEIVLDPSPLENTGHKLLEDQQHFIEENNNVQDIIPPEDRAAQLQALSNTQLDHNQLQFDQHHLKNLSPVEWQCFLMNFIQYLKMSKAGYVVRMSHECDPTTLQQFMTSLNTDDAGTETKNNDDIATNEIENDDEEYTKHSEETKYSHFESTKIAKPNVQDQHELVKLAPHLSGEYFVNTEYVKNYSQIAQEAVNNFIRQNENMGHTNESVSENLSSNDQNQKVKKDLQFEYHNHINIDNNNTLHDVQVNSINNLDINQNEDSGYKLNDSYPNTNGSLYQSKPSKNNEHYLNYQEIINNNNVFQDMLDAFTDTPDGYDATGTLPHETKTSTHKIEPASTSNTMTLNSDDISPPKELFYPKGFSLTKYDQSDFVTEKPILLTAPKKIKIVIPYRKKANPEIRKGNEGKC